MSEFTEALNRNFRNLAEYIFLSSRPLDGVALRATINFHGWGDDVDSILDLDIEKYRFALDYSQEVAQQEKKARELEPSQRLSQWALRQSGEKHQVSEIRSGIKTLEQRVIDAILTEDYTYLAARRSVNRVGMIASLAASIDSSSSANDSDSLLLLLAAYSFGMGLQYAAKPTWSNNLVALGAGIAAIPAAHQVLNTINTGEDWLSAALYSLIPLGAVLYDKWRSGFGVYVGVNMPEYTQKIADLVHSVGDPKEARKRIHRISSILDQMETVQASSLAYDPDREPLLAEFEQACLHYLDDKNAYGKMEQARFSLTQERRPVQERKPTITEVTPDSLPRVFKLTAPEPIAHQETYDLCVQIGVDKDTAKRIARTVKLASAERVISALAVVFPESYEGILKLNPNLMFMRKGELGVYLNEASTIIEKLRVHFDNDLPPEISLDENPGLYSSREGLDFLLSSIEREPEESDVILKGLRSEGYDDPDILRALLVKGFRLGTAKPRVGMAYTPMLKIRHCTANEIGPQNMNKFDDIFSRLQSDRVILDEKAIKKAGGSGGCYSANPHTKQIEKPNLRAFVRSIMYPIHH